MRIYVSYQALKLLFMSQQNKEVPNSSSKTRVDKNHVKNFLQAGSDCDLNARSDAAADLLPNPGPTCHPLCTEATMSSCSKTVQFSGHPVPLWIPWLRLHPVLRGPDSNHNPGTDDSKTNNPTSDDTTTDDAKTNNSETDNSETNDTNNSCTTTRQLRHQCKQPDCWWDRVEVSEWENQRLRDF